MFRFHPRRHALVLLAGVLAGSAVTGCSKDADRSPTLETAASPAPPAVPVDSVRKTDSMPAADTAPTQTAATKKPAAAPPRRTPPAPSRDTTVAVRPAADTSAPPTAAPSAVGQDQWLKYDPATNTVTFELIGGPRGFEFNGYANGGATLTLPPKANVVMNFVNKDGTPHSAVVIPGEGPLPNAEGDPAIPRAYTNQLLQGLPQEASDGMRFAVPESGKYRIFCGVPGHGLSGMWIWMVVDPAAKAPSFGPTKA